MNVVRNKPRSASEKPRRLRSSSVAVYELLNVTDDLRHFMIHSTEGGGALKKKAMDAGMRTLRQSALTRLRDGITSIEEVVRVTTPD